MISVSWLRTSVVNEFCSSSGGSVVGQNSRPEAKCCYDATLSSAGFWRFLKSKLMIFHGNDNAGDKSFLQMALSEV